MLSLPARIALGQNSLLVESGALDESPARRQDVWAEVPQDARGPAGGQTEFQFVQSDAVRIRVEISRAVPSDTNRYENYHTSRDTADTLDYNRMAMVVQGVYRAVVAATK